MIPFVAFGIIWIVWRVGLVWSMCDVNVRGSGSKEFSSGEYTSHLARYGADLLTAFFLGALCQYAHWFF